MIPIVHSIKSVERQYSTGEEPLLVLCSDLQEYVCKYARTGGAAYKMANELIGSSLANIWQLYTPTTAFVRIMASHWAKAGQSGTMAFGCRKLDNVVDITPTTINCVDASFTNLKDLLHIALFDFWVANEDRNANNANLMYDVERRRIISIDYGCIFNTAMYDYPMSQLTATDTILDSDLFLHLKHDISQISQIQEYTNSLRIHFNNILEGGKPLIDTIINGLPDQWNVPRELAENKLEQLFDSKWSTGVWDNFMECVEDNMKK